MIYLRNIHIGVPLYFLFKGEKIMSEKRTSVFENSMIWFGAGVSIAEILTGISVAPLGFSKGFLAIIVGHLIGCVLLFLAGLIGGKTEKSAMETVKISFGQKGSLLFAGLNILQLVGWTAIMIVSGSVAANSVANLGNWVWCFIIGALIVLWILIGIKNLDRVNIVAMSALFVLTLILSFVIFKGDAQQLTEGISFGAVVELSVAMPLSWLPLISDYTRSAKKPFAASFASSVTYFFVSCWMYVIGMGAAIFTGQNDIAQILLNAGLGIAALVIVIFSTVTTTFLDAYSAGVSCESISKKLKEKPMAILVCIIGILLAAFTPIVQIESFLYIIGSVFAPMIAILITDYFILKRDSSSLCADWSNLIIWFAGFIIYRLFMNINTPVGYTLPAMVIVSVITVLVDKLRKIRKHF